MKVVRFVQTTLGLRNISLSGIEMPKHKEDKNKSSPTISTPISKDDKGTILIKILAKPGAKHNNITDISEDGVGVQIAAPPVEGAANTELLKYLSTVLGVKKSELSLEKGSKSRGKCVSITGTNLNVEDIIARLNKEKDGL